MARIEMMTKKEFVYVYPYPCKEAKRLEQFDLWRESWKENIACKNAIEEAIRRDFDGTRLNYSEISFNDDDIP